MLNDNEKIINKVSGISITEQTLTDQSKVYAVLVMSKDIRIDCASFQVADKLFDLLINGTVDIQNNRRPSTADTIPITERSKQLFIKYANDAGNWNGTPLVGGNVGGSKEDRGNLTQLKKAGLVETFTEEDASGWNSPIKAKPTPNHLGSKLMNKGGVLR